MEESEKDKIELEKAIDQGKLMMQNAELRFLIVFRKGLVRLTASLGVGSGVASWTGFQIQM